MIFKYRNSILLEEKNIKYEKYLIMDNFVRRNVELKDCIYKF